MILVVAPYSPGGCEQPNLGAARKLESVLAALHAIDEDILFVNSAHNRTARAGMRQERATIAGIRVRLITLPTQRSRPLGKLANLAACPCHVRHFLAAEPRPRLVWIYNGYAYETRFARHAAARAQCPVLMQFEDWHFSRRRPLGLKPWLDYLGWVRSAPRIAAAFCVNSNLVARSEARGIRSFELPGIVTPEASRLRQASPPFATPGVTTVGYFGGLSPEKGCDQLLRVIEVAPGSTRFVICGSGPLLEAFRRLQTAQPHRLQVLSGLSYAALLQAMAACDVLVNPHSTDSTHLFGLFPSKVLEAIGTGRLVVSTRLPPLKTAGVLDGVRCYDGTDAGLLQAIAGARQDYHDRRHVIEGAAAAAVSLFGVAALRERIASFASPTP